MKKNTLTKIIIAIIIAVGIIAIIIGTIIDTIRGNQFTAKPVIYLYPEKEMQVSVKLKYDGKLLYTYPSYDNEWNVTAKPDGTLTNSKDKKEYSYLFWEGKTDTKYDMSRGFVVKGKDTAVFLQDKLSEMGLTPKEYNEFIVYWLPKMQDNPYNLITFQGKSYTNSAKLKVDPKPDSVLRVFMAYKKLNKPVEIEKPDIKEFHRRGFTVVEWGGTEVK